MVGEIHGAGMFPVLAGGFFQSFNDRLVRYCYGQLAAVLRARYCDPRIQAITKSDGLTWKVKEILDAARKLASAKA